MFVIVYLPLLSSVTGDVDPFVFVDEYDKTMKIRILLATMDDLENGAGDKAYFLHRSLKSGELRIGYHNAATFRQMRECGFIDYIEFELNKEADGFRFPPDKY